MIALYIIYSVFVYKIMNKSMNKKKTIKLLWYSFRSNIIIETNFLYLYMEVSISYQNIPSISDYMEDYKARCFALYSLTNNRSRFQADDNN